MRPLARCLPLGTLTACLALAACAASPLEAGNPRPPLPRTAHPPQLHPPEGERPAPPAPSWEEEAERRVVPRERPQPPREDRPREAPCPPAGSPGRPPA